MSSCYAENIHSQQAEKFPANESPVLRTDLSSAIKIILSRGCAMRVGAVFDDVSTKFLGEVFDAVFAMLHGAHYSDAVREAIADRVIEFGRTTFERDPQRLARAVIASLGIKL
jgi:hypothetical protein